MRFWWAIHEFVWESSTSKMRRGRNQTKPKRSSDVAQVKPDKQMGSKNNGYFNRFRWSFNTKVEVIFKFKTVIFSQRNR